MAINIEALKALAIKSGGTPGDLSSLTFAAGAYPSVILALVERVEAAERDAALSIVLHRIMGAWGEAYDAPGPKRAYTYQQQPGNLVAHRLGSALAEAAAARGGDSIDSGLSLLKALERAGFGVFQIEQSDSVMEKDPK